MPRHRHRQRRLSVATVAPKLEHLSFEDAPVAFFLYVFDRSFREYHKRLMAVELDRVEPEWKIEPGEVLHAQCFALHSLITERGDLIDAFVEHVLDVHSVHELATMKRKLERAPKSLSVLLASMSMFDPCCGQMRHAILSYLLAHCEGFAESFRPKFGSQLKLRRFGDTWLELDLLHKHTPNCHPRFNASLLTYRYFAPTAAGKVWRARVLSGGVPELGVDMDAIVLPLLKLTSWTKGAMGLYLGFLAYFVQHQSPLGISLYVIEYLHDQVMHHNWPWGLRHIPNMKAVYDVLFWLNIAITKMLRVRDTPELAHWNLLWAVKLTSLQTGKLPELMREVGEKLKTHWNDRKWWNTSDEPREEDYDADDEGGAEEKRDNDDDQGYYDEDGVMVVVEKDRGDNDQDYYNYYDEEKEENQGYDDYTNEDLIYVDGEEDQEYQVEGYDD